MEGFCRHPENPVHASDIETRLLYELNRLRMTGNDFNQYFSQFHAYRQHLPTIYGRALIVAFITGLEASLQYAVSLAKPEKLEDAYEAAWLAHLEPPAPWKQYVDQAEERIASKVHRELETFSQQAGQFITKTN